MSYKKLYLEIEKLLSKIKQLMIVEIFITMLVEKNTLIARFSKDYKPIRFRVSVFKNTFGRIKLYNSLMFLVYFFCKVLCK